MKQIMKLVGVVVGACAVGPALAVNAVDVTAATTMISGEVTSNLALIGVALLTLAAVAVGIKWLKATIFG